MKSTLFIWDTSNANDNNYIDLCMFMLSKLLTFTKSTLIKRPANYIYTIAVVCSGCFPEEDVFQTLRHFQSWEKKMLAIACYGLKSVFSSLQPSIGKQTIQ